MIDLYETMNMKTPKAPRSEVLRLPVIKAAKEGDTKALNYLKDWTKEEPITKDPHEMNRHELEAFLLREYRGLLLEKRRRELEGEA